MHRLVIMNLLEKEKLDKLVVRWVASIPCEGRGSLIRNVIVHISTDTYFFT